MNVTLGKQNCQIKIYQKSTGVYLDLSIENIPLVNTILCLDRVKLIRHSYLGFVGNLAFVDTQGMTDPIYTGMGSRYCLIYF